MNPEVLRWARETAGLSVEEAARKLGLKESRGVQAPARLEALEAGDVAPSRPMLVKMAKLYRRSLLVFYLAQPPRRADRGRDFRTLIGPRDRAEDALLDVLIRNLRARQELVRALLDEEDDVAIVPFVGAGRLEAGVAPMLALLEQSLKVGRDELRTEPGPDAAFRRLREAAERAGVFVLLMGDLGNHHSAISVETFRGFAIADPVAPFIAINDRDSHAALSFTLLHELAHLCLGQTGVSALRGDAEVERFCNLVAGEFLLPGGERREATADREGSPSHYRRRSHRLGNALIDLVARGVRTQSLSASKAGFVLGVDIKQVQPLIDLRTFGAC